MRPVPIIVVLASIALSACASDARVASANPNSVTVSYKPTKVEDANETAQKYCGAYNRQAQFRSTHTEPNGRLLGIYDCVAAGGGGVP